MASETIDPHDRPMLFAGAIDIPTELVIAVLIGFLLVAALVVGTGGLLAWAIGGHRRSAFWLGSLAFLVVVILTARPFGLDGSIVAAYASAAAVGGVHHHLARRRSPGPPSLSP